MKNRGILVSIIFVLLLALFTACDKQKSDDTNKTVATSTTGNVTTQKSIIDIEIFVAATNLKFHMGDTFNTEGLKVRIVYSDSSKSEEIPTNELIIVTPDLTTKGKKEVTIKYIVNSIEYETSYEITVDHSITLVDRKEATCTENGNIKYWYCSDCEKYYSDEDCLNEITEASTTILATGHDYGSWVHDNESTPSTHTKVCDNDSSHKETNVCTFDEGVYTSPTCTKKGYTTYTCTVCGYSYVVEDELTTALGHIDGGIVCNGDGTHAHICERCNVKYNQENCTNENGICPVCQENATIGLTYTYQNNGYIFSRTEEVSATNIVIPSCYNDGTNGWHPVTGIGANAFSGYLNLVNLTIPDSIKSIEEYSFYNCTEPEKVYYDGTIEQWCNITIGEAYANLMQNATQFYMKNASNEYEEVTSITIPNTITSIKAKTFNGFSMITSVTLPASVEVINYSAFDECTSLTDVYYEGTIEDWCNITFGGYANPMQYATHFYIKNATNGYEEVTNITIPNTITSIKDCTFWGFNNVTRIEIPNTVISIGSEAFANCTKLASIVISSNVENMGERSFYNCKKLANITISSSVESIREDAFSRCINLENVYYEGTIEDWCNIAFGVAGGANPMQYATHFYMKNASNGYEEVTNIIILNTITSIKDCTFWGFNNVTNITIPNTIESIGEYAFRGCSSLTNITIPSEIVKIDSYAFYECYKLVEVYDLSNLDVRIGGLNNGYVGYYAIVVHKKNNDESKLLNMGDYTFILDENSCSLVSYNGKSSEIILHGAFVYSGKEIISYKIHKYAFYNCTNLTSIKISSNVESIGVSAFFGCVNLNNLYYEGTIKQWCNISFMASDSNPMNYANHFYMRNSTNVYEEVTSIEIPNTVTAIGNYSFINLKGKISMTIPSSIESIGNFAFSNCTALKEVYIKSSMVASSITSYSSAGYLIDYATTIYIESSITTIGSYITNNYTKSVSTEVINNVTYYKYAKNV